MFKHFLNPASQKEKILKQVYIIIKKHGPISKNSIIEITGIKKSTCSRFIDELLQERFIRESGYGESNGGRKPLLYEIVPTCSYLIGIDISRRYTNVLLMDLNLKVKAQDRLTMNETSTPEKTIDFISSKIKEFMDRYQLTTTDILGIGIGSIGPLDRESGTILNPLDFPAPGWRNVEICDILQERLGMKAFIDNGANTALLAEYENTLFKSYQNIVYIIKGVGTRAGIIMDGRLIRGTDRLGMHGHGHMVVDIHGRKCSCGGYGCTNAYASIAAIKNDIINAIKRGNPSILQERVTNIETIEFDDICQAVNENDELCCQIVKNAAFYTGVALSNLINVLSPDLIIFSGPTYNKMDLFYKTVTETALAKSKVIFPDHHITFSRGTLGENASAIGAGAMVFDYYLNG